MDQLFFSEISYGAISFDGVATFTTSFESFGSVIPVRLNIRKWEGKR